MYTFHCDARKAPINPRRTLIIQLFKTKIHKFECEVGAAGCLQRDCQSILTEIKLTRPAIALPSLRRDFKKILFGSLRRLSNI